MTRETKMGLLVGLGIILAIGIVVSDYMSVANHQAPPVMTNPTATNDYDADSSQTLLPDYTSQLRGDAAGPQRTAPIYTPEELRARDAHADDRQPDRHEVDRPDNRRAEGGPVRVAEIAPVNHTESAQARVHFVLEGETLWDIAVRYYNDGRLFSRIAQANAGAVQPNGAVRAGVRLVIPPLPSTDTPRFTPVESDTPRRIDLPADPDRNQLRPQPNTAMARTVKVQEGDTLSSIAAKHLGSAGKWQSLYEANRDQLANPDRVKPGMTLKLPADAPVLRENTAAANREASVDPPTPGFGANSAIYVVRSGDTLSSIAAAKLGSESKWHDLWQHNRKVLPDANALKPGMEIRLP